VIPSSVFSIHTHSTQSAPPRTLHALSHCKHASRSPRTILQKHILCCEKLETVLTEHILYCITRDTFTPHTVVDRTYSVLYHKRYIHPTHSNAHTVMHTRTPTLHTIYKYRVWCARIHSTHAHTCTPNRAQRAHCRRYMVFILEDT